MKVLEELDGLPIQVGRAGATAAAAREVSLRDPNSSEMARRRTPRETRLGLSEQPLGIDERTALGKRLEPPFNGSPCERRIVVEL